MVAVSHNVQHHSKHSHKKEDKENVSHWVNSITHKVPIVQNLEKRLDIMQGLDPVMDGILERMQMVTDNSHLKELQADAKLSQASPDTDLSNGDTYHVLNAATPKDYAVSKVLDTTLRKID